MLNTVVRRVHIVAGFTVAEMIVAMSVLSIVLVLALSSVAPALKITRNSEERLSAQREVVLALDRLTAEMNFLDRALVTVAPESILFVSDEVYNGPNLAINSSNWIDLHNTSRFHTWQKAIILRRRDGQLWRREYPYEFGSNLFRLDPTTLETIADVGGIAEKNFCQNVEEFQVELVGRSRVLLRLRSVFRNAKKPASCDIQVQIQMKGER